MKAVVLARGEGRRMRAAADAAGLTEAQRTAAASGQKGMMPIGVASSRPFLDYVLSSLADAGCVDVCLVVAPEHDALRTHYERARPARLRLHYAVQDEPTGTAHAVLAARAFAAGDAFLVLNADNLYPVDVLGSLVRLAGPGLPAFEPAALVEDSGFPTERVAQFALIEIDDEGWLKGIVEKPGADRLAAAGPRALVSMNVWRFDTGIFDACREVARSARGEFELPEAVALAVSHGVRFRVIPARGAVLDLSTRSDITQVSERLAGLEPRL